MNEKKTIRINESQINSIIENSLRKIFKESVYKLNESECGCKKNTIRKSPVIKQVVKTAPGETKNSQSPSVANKRRIIFRRHF